MNDTNKVTSYVLVLFATVFVFCLGGYVGDNTGRLAVLQSVTPVACEAKQDSVVVHPVRQPRGKVK